MSFTKFGAEIWRDYITAGNPASGVWNIVKADMRDWMAAVEDGLGDVGTYLTADWSSPTAYAVNDIVWHNAVDYICIGAHTSGASTEPGVGVDWETYWETLAAHSNPTGSVTAPGITFGADPDTGLYRTAANVLGITAGGSMVATFSSAGLVLATALGIAYGGTGAGTDSDARTNLGLAIGSDVQAYSANLDSWAAITRASGFDTFVATPTSANLRSLLSDETGTGALYFAGGNAGTPSAINLTNGTALPLTGLTSDTTTALGIGSINLGHASDTTITRVSAGLIAVEGSNVLMASNIGSLVQAYDADLTTLGAGGSGARDFLGLGTGDSPQFTAIQLGHASDTTVARVSAGVVSIEGSNILTAATGQPLDATLTALAAFNTNGLLTQTAADTFAGRTLTGTAGLVTVTNGDGVAGNPTITVADAAAWTFLIRNAGSTGAPAFAALADFTEEASPASGDFVLGLMSTGEIRTFDIANLPGGAGGGMAALVEDTSPQLGGDLDTNGFDIIVKNGDVISAGHTAADVLKLGAWDVDGAAFVSMFDITSNNTVTGNLNTAVTIGGAAIYRAAGTDVALADGGTGASLSDPNADRIMFWDDSAGQVTWLSLGSGLSISGTTLDTTASGGMTLIDSGSLPAATTKDITSIAQTYAYLVIQLTGVSSDTATRQPYLQLSTDNSTFDTTGTNYVAFNVQTGVTSLASVWTSVNMTAAQTADCIAILYGYQAGTYTMYHYYVKTAAGGTDYAGHGYYKSTSAIQAIRFLWNGSGNFDAGTYAVYGVS